MAAQRLKNQQWTVHESSSGGHSYEAALLTVAMDLRDELQAIRGYASSLPGSCVSVLRSILKQLKLQRRCPVHPRYTGARPPRAECRACKRLYKAVWK